MVSLLDANIIIRFIVETDGILFDKSTSILTEVEQGLIQVIIPPVVFAECFFVLTKFYDKKRSDVVEYLQEVLLKVGVVNNDRHELQNTFEMLAVTNLDFVDAYLIALKRSRGHEILTFDRDIEKYLKKHS